MSTGEVLLAIAFVLVGFALIGGFVTFIAYSARRKADRHPPDHR